MSVNETIWSPSAIIKSSVLLQDPTENWVLQFADKDTQIEFAVPEPVVDERWGGWERTIRPTWSYKITMKFPGSDSDDAIRKAFRYLDDLVNLLLFMASAPVQIESYGSIEAPADDVGSGKTKLIVLNAIDGHLAPPITITKEGIEGQLMPMFGNTALSKKRKDNISRSLSWLQHSYSALTPIDEFLCLMFAIEGIATLLGEGKPLYWRCEGCNTQYENCPNCGKSTSRPSGSSLTSDFLKLHAGWSGKKWNTLWSLRSKIAHGDQDLSTSETDEIEASLADLEYAINKALKFVMKLPDHFPPTNGRFRPRFRARQLTIVHGPPKPSESDEQ